MRVLVTGAFGRVGTAIIEQLGDRDEYEFSYLDREPHPGHPATVADITDYDAIRPAFDEQDAIIHLAGNPSPSASWESILENNIIGTHNVFTAANAAEVEKIMFASTNHVMGMYHAELTESEPPGVVDHTDPPRPDSYYAVSKLLGEHLGRYLVEAKTSPRQFYAIRIGWVLGKEYDHPAGGAERAVDAGDITRSDESYKQRARSCEELWCSRRDMAQITDCVLQDESVTFDIFAARSEGSRQFLDIEHAREVLGFDPIDDADSYEGHPVETS